MDDLQQPDDSVTEQTGPEISFTPIYTYILIASIAVVFFAQLLFGDAAKDLFSLVGDERSANAAGLVKWEVFKYHEYWRLLTGAAVHGGLIHVVMNCYAFLMFGRLCEMLSNRAHTAIVFLLASL